LFLPLIYNKIKSSTSLKNSWIIFNLKVS
jgi:hypothetical protein